MQQNDCRDWFVMVFVANLATAATVYLFMHPSNAAFGIWGTALTTIGGIFHWLTIMDAKAPDSCGVPR